MFIIILIFIQIISSSLGNGKYITVLNINPVSDYNYGYQCYTPYSFSGYSLSYGRLFKIEESDDLSEFSWTERSDHRYLPPDTNMGVYFCKIEIDGKTTIVRTTKIRIDAEITPSDSISSLSVNVGDNVTISFNGNAEWEVMWRKDNVELNNGITKQKSMTFNPVNTIDAGMYEVYRYERRSLRKHSFINLIVRACPRHKWGPPECKGDCDYCYNGGVCDDKEGFCICAPGFSGINCENQCGGNRFGWNCETRCTRHNIPNGCMGYHFCLPDPYGCSCVAGFNGRECKTECESGKFGASCTQSCHCNKGGCDIFTGQCNDELDKSCAFPWTGTNCQECQDGFYGENCELLCTKPCDCHRGTGNCIAGTCYPNWLEPKCEIRIINTTSTSVNDGQKIDVDCTIYNVRGTDDIQPLIIVIGDSVTKNITASSSTADENIITYEFSVKAEIGLEYRCVILQDGASVHIDFKLVIFLLPSYNGSLKLVTTLSSSIVIEWTAWNNKTDDGDGPITGYYLYYKMSNAENWENKQYQESLSGTVTGLMWDTMYIFAVSAVRPGKGGEGPVGKPQLSAVTLCGKPIPVESPKHNISNTNSQNLLITWTEINVSPETLKCYNTSYNYNVYIKLKDGDGIGDLVYKGNDSQVIIENIGVNASLYTIWVTVSNKDDESQAAESIDSTAKLLNTNEDSGLNLGIIGGVIGAAVGIFTTAIIVVKRTKSKNGKKECTESNVRFKAEGLPPQSETDDGNDSVVDETRNFKFNDSLTAPLTESEMLVYENVAVRQSNFSRKIPISHLIYNINKMELQQEFDLLPVNQTRPWTTAAKECHRPKNRFKNIIPYDHARVVLDTVDGNPDSDYYNASYINGYNKQKHYLACQGPNVPSLKDFWRLIWQLNIEVIVMLTNVYEGDKKKCEKYWPDKQELLAFDGINVSVTSQETNTDYVIRTIGVWREGGMIRTIKQFHFTVWPDKGVPKSASGLLSFIKKVQTARGSSDIPLLVHCSSGIGQTGTYIVIDAMLAMIKEERSVDVLKYVKDIRGDRINIVQTVNQYLFIYNALTESYLNDTVQFPLSQFTKRLTSLKRTNPETKKTFMEEEFEMLVAVSSSPAPEAMMSGRQEQNIKKNRFANLLPIDQSRVMLNSESNNYTNASFMNGYKLSNRFIATQMPLGNTVNDFWQMVYDWKATTIVMLNAMDQSDPTCAQYWQDEGGRITADNLEIQFISEESRGENIIIRNISMGATNQKSTPTSVTQYQVTNWQVGQDSPDKLETLIELYHIVESSNIGGQHPIVVHCLNGIGRTGIYCAMTEVLDRMKHDDVIDVFQCVKRLREHRPGLVENVDQYTLCYDLVGTYLQRFATYSN